MEVLTEGRVLAAIVGALLGSIIGPVIKSNLDRWTAKRNAKIVLRPEVYETLVDYLLTNKIKEGDLEKLKTKLLVYGKDDVLKALNRVIQTMENGVVSKEHLYNLIIKIRSNLGMSSEFSQKHLEAILKIKSNK